MQFNSRFLFSAFLLLLWGCAPQFPDRTGETDPESQLSDPADPEVASIPSRPHEQTAPDAAPPPRSRPGTPVRPGESVRAPATQAPTAPVQPDWPARYEELLSLHRAAFQRPKVGEVITATMARTGRNLQGRVEEILPNEIKLRIEQGIMSLYPEQVNEATRLRLFEEVYAHHHARVQAYHEYEAWQASQRPAPTPVPRTLPPVDLPSTPEETIRAVSSVPRTRAGAEPPRNMPPDGRVPSVLEYIRRNAANPNSLKVEGWGTVRPHGDGFQVRVRYQLEGADRFGTSREDMVFFMHADGTVYQRAVYRGQ